jgi:DNA invertase Pin-like site-specific DNA recombinase
VKNYVAYYRVSPKSGLSLDAQKAIIQYYSKKDKATITHEFLESDDEKRCVLQQAIRHCQKHQSTLVVAKLDRLSLDIETIFKIKKKLGDLLKCCDLPTTDRLTLSIYVGIVKRQKELYSVKTKAAFQARKAEGATFGNPQNLTDSGRKLGIEKIRRNASESKVNQKMMQLVSKCKDVGMSFGAIAEELNQNKFTTVRGKQFYRTTVKRLYERYLAVK